MSEDRRHEVRANGGYGGASGKAPDLIVSNKTKPFKTLNLTVITGLSGSGKTTTVRALEELGFFCVDNLPLPLLPSFIHLVQRAPSPITRVAVVIDARGHEFFEDIDRILRQLRRHHRARLVYFETRDDVLIQRYNEARRRHPLAPRGSIMEGIDRERKILAPIRKRADKIIDTSDLNVHELKQLLLAYFHHLAPQKGLQISLLSFGYKYGIPIQADLVFDVRFIPNPFFVKALKNKTGRSMAVKKYVLKQRASRLFLEKSSALLEWMTKEYKKSGKNYLTVAFGCTGGKHRSVVIVEAMKKRLQHPRINITVTHRDEKL